MIFKSKIAGIPCAIQVTKIDVDTANVSFAPGVETNYVKAGGNHEFAVLDRKGYNANWLAKKISPNDYTRIMNQIESELKV